MDNKNPNQQAIRILNFFISLLTNSGKTDLNSQIKCIENLNENLIKTPMFISIINSLKELRGIKKNEIPFHTRKVCFFSLKDGKYLDEEGNEITLLMFAKFNHVINDEGWSYIIFD